MKAVLRRVATSESPNCAQCWGQVVVNQIALIKIQLRAIADKRYLVNCQQ